MIEGLRVPPTLCVCVWEWVMIIRSALVSAPAVISLVFDNNLVSVCCCCCCFTDCLECMACSDNVVRAGLTPKFKDIDTLCSMLDYQPGPVDRFTCHWTDEDEFCQVSAPPVPDFAMARLRLPVSSDVYQLPIRSSASILLVLQGHASTTIVDNSEKVVELRAGQILFLKAGQSMNPIKMNEQQQHQQEDLVIYQAFANVWTMSLSSRKLSFIIYFLPCPVCSRSL